MNFQEYVKWARKAFPSNKMTDAQIISDYVTSNLKLCHEAIKCAAKMNWGARAHDGIRLLSQVKCLHAELDSRPMSVTPPELEQICKLRQALCDTMWRAEHHL